MSGLDLVVIVAYLIPILAVVTVKWYLPFFRRLNLTSAYEYQTRCDAEKLRNKNRLFKNFRCHNV